MLIESIVIFVGDFDFDLGWEMGWCIDDMIHEDNERPVLTPKSLSWGYR